MTRNLVAGVLLVIPGASVFALHHDIECSVCRSHYALTARGSRLTLGQVVPQSGKGSDRLLLAAFCPVCCSNFPADALKSAAIRAFHFELNRCPHPDPVLH